MCLSQTWHGCRLLAPFLACLLLLCLHGLHELGFICRWRSLALVHPLLLAAWAGTVRHDGKGCVCVNPTCLVSTFSDVGTAGGVGVEETNPTNRGACVLLSDTAYQIDEVVAGVGG